MCSWCSSRWHIAEGLSVALAHLLAEDRRPRDALWRHTLV
jgi:hypothetical protein